MPLSRATVTAASRIMLPAYIIHASYYGLLYLIDPGGRNERAPGLTAARAIMDMWTWGLVLLLFAALMIAALVTGARALMMFALYAYSGALIIWAGIYAAAPLFSADASYGGPGWPLLAATACVASAVSLNREEV